MKTVLKTLRRSPARALIMTLLLLTLASPAIAQEGDAPKKADNAIGFEAAKAEDVKETLPGWPFLYGAYGVIWLLIFVYLGVLWRKQAQITGQINAVDKRLDEVDRALEELGQKS